MSSKIEMSRELAQWALDSVDECIMRNEPEKLEELRTLLAAPVVERQPDAWWYAVNGMWEWCADREYAVKELAEFRADHSAEELAELKADGLLDPQALYVSPPELAELQATIATLSKIEDSIDARQNRIDAINLANCVDFGFDDKSVKVSQEAYSIFIAREAHYKATIAEQVVEIERLKGGQGEAIIEGSVAHEELEGRSKKIRKTLELHGLMSSDASQPAPVSVVLPEREVMRDLIAEVIGGDTYDCTRVWSAWGVGTMSEDDFVPFVEQEERLYELADACLDKVKEMNQ